MSSSKAVKRTSPKKSPRVKIPLYKGQLAAGAGVSNDDDDEIIDGLAFRRDWLQANIKAPINQLRMVKIKGESMEPTIFDGDVVMVDCSQTMPKQNGVYPSGRCRCRGPAGPAKPACPSTPPRSVHI